MNLSLKEAIDDAMDGRKQSEIALALGWPESKVSELLAPLRKSDTGILLNALNIKAVPKHLECFDSKKVTLVVEALKLASQGLNINHLKSEL